MPKRERRNEMDRVDVALAKMRENFLKHKGHTLTYSYERHPQHGQSFELVDAVITDGHGVRRLMLKGKGESFATHYSDAMFKCSCGEG